MDDATTPESEAAPAAPAMLHGVLLAESCGQRVLHPGRDQYLKLAVSYTHLTLPTRDLV